jgi:hypothetical protein
MTHFEYLDAAELFSIGSLEVPAKLLTIADEVIE